MSGSVRRVNMEITIHGLFNYWSSHALLCQTLGIQLLKEGRMDCFPLSFA